MELLIFTDGGSRGNPGPAGIGGVVYRNTKGGEVVYEFSEYLGTGTNNEAEYTALLHSIKWLSEYDKLAEIEHVTWHLDSKLVVEQVSKNWKIKSVYVCVLLFIILISGKIFSLSFRAMIFL